VVNHRYRPVNISTEPSRLPTGVPGFDSILSGGLLKGHMYLVDTKPGTGKTTVGMQFLTVSRRTGERCLYVTLSESKAELEATAKSHG